MASFDPVAVDAVGSRLLGHNPAKIKYLALANGVLGDMDNIEIILKILLKLSCPNSRILELSTSFYSDYFSSETDSLNAS